MKKSIGTFAVLAMLASLFTGCGKDDKTAEVAPEAVEKAATWAPETAGKVDDHAGHDHSDHSGHKH